MNRLVSILAAVTLHTGAVVAISILAGAWRSPEVVIVPPKPPPLAIRMNAGAVPVLLAEAAEPEESAPAPVLRNRKVGSVAPHEAPPSFRIGRPRAAQPPGADREILSAVEVYTPAPKYPPQARKRGIEGRVVVEFTIGADGSVGSVRVVESAHRLLEEAVLEALKEWRFRPARVDGEAVATPHRQSFRFRIDQ
jgi:protein TonB